MTLALLFLRGRRLPALGVVHGLVGAGGIALLVTVLRGPRRGDAMGVGSFGIAAAVLFGIALAIGLTVPLLYRRAPLASGAVIAIHGSVAITAYVLFLAWSSMG